MPATKLDPIEAAQSVGMTNFDFDNLIRENAASRLANLAMQIRRGNESNEGDVTFDDYHTIVAEVWAQIEAAKLLTAAWLQEEIDPV